MNKKPKTIQWVSFGLVFVGIICIASGVVLKLFMNRIPFTVSTWVVTGLLIIGLILIIGSVFWADDAMNG